MASRVARTAPRDPDQPSRSPGGSPEHGHDRDQDPRHDASAGQDGHRRAARSLPAGLADVALGSATSFIVGIDAARNLDSVSLGLWGLIFSAYLLASVIPTEFILVPLEASLVSRPFEEQLRSVPRTMLLSAIIGVPASVSAMALAASFSRDVSATLAGRAALLGVVLGVASPLQDHIRRLLHQAGWSVGAALVSLIQLSIVVTCVVGLHTAGMTALYVPPLALGTANLLSLGAGVLLARRRAGPGPAAPLRLDRATRMGGWLLGAGVADRATQFACLAMLSLFVGNVGVGQYEATRVAAQPVLVFALGVLSVYRRPIMRGAQQLRRHEARNATRVFTALVYGAALLYAAGVAVDWSANPLTRLTPAAYDRGGFLLAVLVATAVTATAMAPTTELVGSGRGRAYARQIVGQAVVLVVLCFVALLAGAGVFAWPLALGGRGVLLGIMLRRETRRIYRPPATATPLGQA
jgi:O-antigen/teichoic acid export membrane protein